MSVSPSTLLVVVLLAAVSSSCLSSDGAERARRIPRKGSPCFLYMLTPTKSYITKHFDKNLCSCPPVKFETRFHQSYAVVRVIVQNIYRNNWTIYRRLTRPLEAFKYTMFVTGVFKGGQLKRQSTFRANAFTSGDLCGMKLSRNKEYLLFLDSPWKISRASMFPRGEYFLNQCQRHYRWADVDSGKRKFLTSGK